MYVLFVFLLFYSIQNSVLARLGDSQEVFLQALRFGSLPQFLQAGLGELGCPGMGNPHGIGALLDGSGLTVRGQSIPQAHQSCLPLGKIASHGGNDVRLHLGTFGQVGVGLHVLVHVQETCALGIVVSALALLLVFVVQTQDGLGLSHLSLKSNDVFDLHVQAVGNFFHGHRGHGSIVVLASFFFDELLMGLDNLVPLGLFVEGQLDGSVQRAGFAEGSLDPDGSIGAEADSSRGVKQLGSSQEAERSFLNQLFVGGPRTLAHVVVAFLDNRVHQSHVGRDQELLGTPIGGNLSSKLGGALEVGEFGPFALADGSVFFGLLVGLELVQPNSSLNHLSEFDLFLGCDLLRRRKLKRAFGVHFLWLGWLLLFGVLLMPKGVDCWLRKLFGHIGHGHLFHVRGVCNVVV